MIEFKKYNEFLLEGSNNKEFYKFVLDDIHINIDALMEKLKEKYNMNCWWLYNSVNSVSLGYYQTSNDSEKNINNIKNFLFEELPYFRDLLVYRDDKRMVLKFIEVGDPVRFKFYH